MSLAIWFYCLCTQHVSDVNISIIRILRLCCWITTLVVLFLFRCVSEFWCGWVCIVSVRFDTQRNENKTTNVVIQQHSCKLLMMDILMSETCWVCKKWNKIASDIKLVCYPSAITMMHGPVNIRITSTVAETVQFNMSLNSPAVVPCILRKACDKFNIKRVLIPLIFVELKGKLSWV